MKDALRSSRFTDLLLWCFKQRYRVRVVGQSMLPGLQPGDEVLVNGQAYANARPLPGDIVIAQHPYRPDLRLIKRVVGELEPETYILQGDNPAESSDSRSFGAVPLANILGRVVCRLW